MSNNERIKELMIQSGINNQFLYGIGSVYLTKSDRKRREDIKKSIDTEIARLLILEDELKGKEK